MEEFTATVNERALRERLQDALSGKGAFGRFKRVLADHQAERERWFEFRSERLGKGVPAVHVAYFALPTRSPPAAGR